MTRIRLRNGGTIEIHDTWVCNRFTAGVPQEVRAVPRSDQKAMATAMGYTDAAALTRDHDPLHALLADWLGLGCSYSLNYAAGWLPPEEAEMARFEEAAVMALQAYIVQLGLTAVEIAKRNGYQVEEV
jgi:hypothetical protein